MILAVPEKGRLQNLRNLYGKCGCRTLRLATDLLKGLGIRLIFLHLFRQFNDSINIEETFINSMNEFAIYFTVLGAAVWISGAVQV